MKPRAQIMGILPRVKSEKITKKGHLQRNCEIVGEFEVTHRGEPQCYQRFNTSAMNFVIAWLLTRPTSITSS